MSGFFKGDIAEIRVWQRALTREEMLASSKKAAQDYGFRLLSQAAYEKGDLPSGLGAAQITVASGAKLVLPRSAKAPLTLTAGQTISGAGLIAGTVKLDPGGVLDATEAAPSKIENLVLAGGTVAYDAANPMTLAVGDFDVTAGGTLLVKGALTDKFAFLAYEKLTGDPSALTVTSEAGERLKVVHDPVNKRLVVKMDWGMLLIVR